MKVLDKTSPSIKRQTWLHDIEVALRERFKAQGYKVPATVRTSIGFPKGTKDGKKILGQCWANVASTDEHNEIFISPELGHAGKPTVQSSVDIIGVMAHELAHSISGNKAGHRVVGHPDHVGHMKKGTERYAKRFEKWRMSFPTVAASVGLIAPWTSTEPNEEFVKWAKELIDNIGMFPAGALTSFNRKKDGCRQLKCECPDCGYIVRTTKKWIEAAGPPICPTDERKMECDSPD